MSAEGREYAKATVVTLVPTGLAFFLTGWVVGIVCLFCAGALSLVLWTPVGPWLGYHRDARGAPIPAASDSFAKVEEELARIHQEASELARERRKEWPYLAPDLEAFSPPWIQEVHSFICLILGPAQAVAFEAAARKGADELARLESISDFLGAISTSLTPEMVRADAKGIAEAGDRRRAGALARLHREGEKLMGECGAPDQPPTEQLAVRLGAPAVDQVEREDKAREWDERVSVQLQGRLYLRQLAPGWEKAGKPIGKAAGHPDQSTMSGDSLKAWYQGKLDCLWQIIQTVSPSAAPS